MYLKPMHAVRLAVAAAVLIGLSVAAALLGLSGTGASRYSSLRTYVKATSVLEPDCRNATTRTYPQVARSGIDLRRVNTALRRAVVQAAFQPDRQWCLEHPLPTTIFLTMPDQRLMSASTEVVSALIPTLDIPPTGNNGAGWLDVTVLVPSGRVVRYQDLFAPGGEPPQGVARVIRREAIRENACVRGMLKYQSDPTTKLFASAFAAGYSHEFALTPRGLVIGFSDREATGPACGQIAITVPYRLLNRYMSGLGERLVLGVRPPAG
jgi:hypothetical protein